MKINKHSLFYAIPILLIGCSITPNEGVDNIAGKAQPITLNSPANVESSRPPLEWSESSQYIADGPYPINLADVPAGQYDPLNKLAREWGLSGGPKRMRGPIPEAEADRLRAEALNMKPNRSIQPFAPEASMAISGVGFDSLDINDCCGGGANVPPDPELAVGPNHIIAVVNVAFEIYDKTGTLLSGPITFSSFFSGTPGCTSTSVFDPNVLYDEENDRFILAIDGNGTDYCIAAATTADPLGSWNRYGFPTNFSGAFFDYPHAGVGVDAIYMGSNQFGGSLPGGFEGRVFAINRAELISGAASLQVATHSTGVNGVTPQPMNLHGWNQGTWPSSGPHYIMTDLFDGHTHSVWSWNDPFGANVFTEDGVVDLDVATGNTAGFPVDVPQAGSSSRLQANDWRGLDTEYHDGKIWMTNAISCNPGSGTVDCIRWAEIDPTGPTVLQAGIHSSDGDYRFFPDLAVNECGDMMVGYTKSNTSIFPSIWAAGRQSTDPAGTLQAEIEIRSGEIDYTAFDSSPHRWGDYTGMTIDPDGKTFWYLGEYSKNTGNGNGRWGTYIGSMSFEDCGGAVNEFTLAVPVPGVAGVINTFDVVNAEGNRVGLYVGAADGSTVISVPGCPSMTIDIANARRFAGARVDSNGDASISRNIPGQFGGKTRLFQAADNSCQTSNVASHSFP